MNKKYLISSLVAVTLVVSAIVTFNGNVASAIESYFYRLPETYVATTTTSFMTAGTGTTTNTYPTMNIDKVDVFINFSASSTESILNWKYEYSNNNVDWFGENRETVTTNILIAHSSTTPVHTYQPNNISTTTATTTNSIVVTFPDIASNWKRIVFSIPVGAGRGAVWAEATLKRNAQ